MSPKLRLNHKGTEFLRLLSGSHYSTFYHPYFKCYKKSSYPEQLQNFAERVHFDPLFICSFNELYSHMKAPLSSFSDESSRGLLAMYSYFVLHICGKISSMDIVTISSLNEQLLFEAIGCFEKFDELTNAVYCDCTPVIVDDIDSRVSTDWFRYQSMKCLAYGDDPQAYLQRTYGRGFTGMHLNVLYGLDDFINRPGLCFLCYGCHEFGGCTRGRGNVKYLFIERWLRGDFNLDVDEKLKSLLDFPLFSVYHILCYVRGTKYDVACYCWIDEE